MIDTSTRAQMWLECAADPACFEMTQKTSVEAVQIAMGLATLEDWALEEDAALSARCALHDIMMESKRLSLPKE